MSAEIVVTTAASSRRGSVDLGNPGFGDVFSDHMFVMDHVDGEWRDPRIEPYGPFSIEPGALCLHYGQTVFEGLKAFLGEDGRIRIFRPDRNAARLRDSCRRLCIPEPDAELLLEAIDALVLLDREWIPSRRGQALYIRPLVIGDESNLNVRPSRRYRLFIMTSPVREYFDRDRPSVALKAERRYTRAAPGGMGYAKTAGNYAASLLPGAESQRAGHDQVLWLDGVEHRYVEEVGQMNIFFVIDDTVVTPELRGTILPGVTRDSVLQLLGQRGIACQERRVEIAEIADAAASGRLREAFGAGTAAVIAPVGRITVDDQEIAINDGRAGPLAQELYEHILDIQTGRRDDPFGWNRMPG